MSWLIPRIYLFVLIAARLGGFTATSPFPGIAVIPHTVRLALVAILSLMFTFLLSAAPLPHPPSMGVALLAIGMELLLGSGMGFVLRLVAAAAETAGQWMGMQIGLSMANVMDPEGPHPMSILSRAMGLFVVAFMLAMDLHHVMLAGLAKSYELLPPGSPYGMAELAMMLVSRGSLLFYTALQIALPVMTAVLMANVSMGVLARIVPQMNVFLVGLILTTTVGFVTLALGAAGWGGVIGRSMEEGLETMMAVFL